MTMATPKTSAPPRGKSKHKVRYFRLRNRLKDKAGIGVTGGGGFAVEAAMKEIDKFSDDYPDFVAGYIKKLLPFTGRVRRKRSATANGTFARSTKSRTTCAARAARSALPSLRR